MSKLERCDHINKKKQSVMLNTSEELKEKTGITGPEEETKMCRKLFPN